MTYVFDNEGRRLGNISNPPLPPGIVSYEFPEYLADSIVDYVKNGPQHIWNNSSVLDIEGEQSIRTSMDCNFDYNFPRFCTDETNTIIDHYVTTYNSQFSHAEISQREPLGILRYGPGQWYDSHCDSHWKVYRVVSMLVYLNPSEYTGGETFFPHFNAYIKPDKPSIVFFPSNYIYEHQALPVESGEKVVIVNWMNDLPKPLHQESMRRLHEALH